MCLISIPFQFCLFNFRWMTSAWIAVGEGVRVGYTSSPPSPATTWSSPSPPSPLPQRTAPRRTPGRRRRKWAGRCWGRSRMTTMTRRRPGDTAGGPSRRDPWGRGTDRMRTGVNSQQPQGGIYTHKILNPFQGWAQIHSNYIPFTTKTHKYLFPRGNKPLLYRQIGNRNFFIFITNQ